jgi:hypothetical protein
MENSMEEDPWEDNIRRDSLLLNIRGWRRWAGYRDIWRRTI